MCFSAEARINKNYLEAKYSAIFDEVSFMKYKTLNESEPKKYRSIEDNQVIFVNYYAPVIFNSSPKESFKGFAIVTDEPPVEIIKAGHNRCLVYNQAG